MTDISLAKEEYRKMKTITIIEKSDWDEKYGTPLWLRGPVAGSHARARWLYASGAMFVSTNAYGGGAAIEPPAESRELEVEFLRGKLQQLEGERDKILSYVKTQNEFCRLGAGVSADSRWPTWPSDLRSLRKAVAETERNIDALTPKLPRIVQTRERNSQVAEDRQKGKRSMEKLNRILSEDPNGKPVVTNSKKGK